MKKEDFPQHECGVHIVKLKKNTICSYNLRHQFHKVKVVDKDGNYKPIQRSKKFFKNAINYHRFHADMFLGVIDRQLQELNNKFDEVNPELLRCMSSFSPAKSFSDFNVDNLVKLAKFYPNDFDVEEMNQLTFQLNRYISDVSKDENFTNLMSLADLSMMLVKTNKVSRYDLVYKLLKFVLVLPVATASVERVFSSMNYIKNKLRSKMGQEYLNDCLVIFIERYFFLQVKNEDIINHFQNIKKRKVLLYIRWRRYSDDDDSYPSRLPINLDDRARHGDSGDGRPSFFSSALKQEESARGWGVVVEERGASAVGEVASVVVPGWFGHDTSAVDDDGNELGTTVSGDSKLAHLCDFFLSFAPFF
ncbi:hypothetical protein OsJ_31590 [Oryza sativa Japonica Group]|uniref:HAT C-terminal dimerisation domain-containing protein n=1 Tax=Oryza sativa subsp. japonica TaxID=39947 RepID=A3C4Y1_ORYSJ|nr:hypothetical protein OsJ_31590 [Oryza sativa Japonica Group]